MEVPAEPPLTFSIVIPTFQRRDVVVASVEALARQNYPGPFDVVVVVDGSTDGSAEALRALQLPFPLTVIEQGNSGAASARNRGASGATSEILLFLDDDMEGASDLLTEHARSYTGGADAVIGHIPLHPESPRNFLTAAIGEWVDSRAQGLAGRSELGLFDLLTGQLSVRRELFERLGGFDCAFTDGGSYGDEDLDFGWRLLKGGHSIKFNSAAVTRQRYVVGFAHHLRQWREAGRANVALTRKHPELGATLLQLQNARAPQIRFAARPLSALPAVGRLTARLTQAMAVAVAERYPRSAIAARLFFHARDITYWRGVAEAGGIRTGRDLRVLAYHSISTAAGEGELTPYVIDPETFRRQLELLKANGFHFASARQALDFLGGKGSLPPRAVLVTFDDGYANLQEEAAPILKELGAPAVVFVVSAMLGGWNEWDAGKEQRPRALMSREELDTLRAVGIEVGAHSRTHRSLSGLAPVDLASEVDGALAELDAMGLNPLRLFCYPYGAVDYAAEQRLREAGVAAAFTVVPGTATSRNNPLRVPRIEILGQDGCGAAFLRKVRGGLLNRAVAALRSRMPKRATTTSE